MELVINSDGTFTLTQNLPLDQDVLSNINELVAGVIATDFDGDTSTADIKIKITDGTDPKITDAAVNFIETTDGAPKTGTMTITKALTIFSVFSLMMPCCLIPLGQASPVTVRQPS